MKKIFLILAIGCISLCTSAQDKSLFFLDGVPQSSRINPADTLNFKAYIGIPGLSSINFGAKSSSLSFADIFKKGTGANKDSLYVDLNNIEQKLRSNNFIGFETNLDILDFGFRARKSFLSFTLSSRTSGIFSFSDDIASLRYGNVDMGTLTPRDISLNDFKFNGSSYVELGVGYARSINSKLTVGGRLKILNGLAGIKTSSFKAHVKTTPDFETSTIVARGEVYIQAPCLDFEYNDKGEIDGINFDKEYSFSTNLGMGVDLGATYQLTDKLTLQGSITDLGFIRWKNSSYRLILDGEYDYNGADITPDANGEIDFEKAFTSIIDTLKSKFKPTDESASFTTRLNASFYLGGTYDIAKWLKGGILFNGKLYESAFEPRVTASLNFKPANAFQLNVNYTSHFRDAGNLGAAIVVGMKAFQFYMLVDNIPFRYIGLNTDDTSSHISIPGYAQSLACHLGFNIQF